MQILCKSNQYTTFYFNKFPFSSNQRLRWELHLCQNLLSIPYCLVNYKQSSHLIRIYELHLAAEIWKWQATFEAVSNNTGKSYKLVNIIPFSQWEARALSTSQNRAQLWKDLIHNISHMDRQLLQTLSEFVLLHWQQTSCLCHFIYYFFTATVKGFTHVNHTGKEFILNNILHLDQADESKICHELLQMKLAMAGSSIWLLHQGYKKH